MGSSLSPSIVPASGKAGLNDPPIKEQGKRGDFKPDDFTLQIEAHGYRIAWARAAHCPCSPAHDQTELPSPVCTLCEGRGWIYFTPANVATTEDIGTFTDLQQQVIARYNAAPIRGIMTMGTTKDMPYDKLTYWREGMMNLTVRPENRLGYYDLVVNLDSEMVHYETVKAGPSSSDTLRLRYHLCAVNLLRSETTVFTPDTDFTLENGKIKWLLNQPAEGTRLSCHYQTFPTWKVVSHPHVIRATQIKAKSQIPRTPQGDPTPLPIQAVIQYDFLVGDAGRTGSVVEA